MQIQIIEMHNSTSTLITDVVLVCCHSLHVVCEVFVYV